MKPLYIFDLDGTLALIDHRRHLLEDLSNPNRHEAFYAACVQDGPNLPVLQTLKQLALDSYNGADIWIFSGRSDAVLDQTIRWLNRYLPGVIYYLQMRPAKDHRPDEELKKMWLDSMLFDDRQRLLAVFEDRDRLVKMWRDNGVSCFQVAYGNF